ncbi:hypothetical protein AB0M20_01750 [Actinoplanes sp. NPDC051633]|uniref:hypothetical protein n=1 Tax=Actinoplanes sp. NPDC051633 TaxID=3155670 RepID=UPI00341A2700
MVLVDAGRPAAVRVLKVLLVLTAVATAVVEVLNYRYAPEHGFGLAVRTGWALLRTVGWLILIWHVNRGRAAARPLGLILAITTIFAVGRLVVPQTGAPPLPGLAGFGVLLVLCLVVVALLYRHEGIAGHLVRHPKKLVVTGKGLAFEERAPRRPAVTGWLITARVSAFTYSPLMLVPALIAIGELADRPQWVLAVVFWIAAGIATSYAVLLNTAFLARGKRPARVTMVWIGLGVLVIDLPLAWLLLGVDGLVRDGAPLVAAFLVNVYALWRTGKLGRTGKVPAAT